MASVRRELRTRTRLDAVWDAIRDVGALHTRLVPGFVTSTVLRDDVRTVTFANGQIVDEQIVTIDGDQRRLVWSSTGGVTTHYNASVEALPDADGTRVIWIADFLPNDAKPRIEAAMDA